MPSLGTLIYTEITSASTIFSVFLSATFVIPVVRPRELADQALRFVLKGDAIGGGCNLRLIDLRKRLAASIASEEETSRSIAGQNPRGNYGLPDWTLRISLDGKQILRTQRLNSVRNSDV